MNGVDSLLKLTVILDAVILKATPNLHSTQVCSVVPNISPTVIPSCSDYTKEGDETSVQV